MQNIKAIIFDIGGVVVHSDFNNLYIKFANRAGIDPKLVSQYHRDHWSDLILGIIGLSQFFQAMRDMGADVHADLKSIWLEEALKLRKINTELLAVIENLKKRYTVGVLSNLTATRLMVDEAAGLYQHFDFVLLSCREHLKKPDPEFYELALRAAGAKPDEAIFIDDMERNTIAAKNLGLMDILYTSNEHLLSQLRSLGVTI